MPTDPREKRKAPRIPFVLKVDYDDREAFSDATENLSQGGVFVQTERKFVVGERVPLSLSFPGLLDPIEIIGRVAWIRPAHGEDVRGIGVEAEREIDRMRLERLLSTSNPQPDLTKLPPEGFRVLIVEDNPHIIEMYTYVLKKMAAQDLKGKVPLDVQFAADGHVAFKMLQEQRYHLVMTDLYMPVMDGFQLVERIRQEAALRTMPVIAISAGGRDAQERAMQLGVDIYLRKPVKFVEVLETVKNLLRIH